MSKELMIAVGMAGICILGIQLIKRISRCDRQEHLCDRNHTAKATKAFETRITILETQMSILIKERNEKKEK